MNVFRQWIIRVGSVLSPFWIVVILIALNASWTITLDMFGRQFREVAGALPIDLQNTARILTAPEAAAQIATYSPTAKSLYWSFFILDNIMPPLVFGSFALLWVYLLRHNANPFLTRLLNSPLLLIPFGVGFFDWIENLGFIVAITTYPDPGALTALQIGLAFVYLKAACLFTTFFVTLALILYRFSAMLRQVVLAVSRTQGRTT